MTNHTTRSLLIAALLAGLLAGCGVTHPPARKPPYLGRTQTLSEVVAAINANNRPITSLWAAHRFDAWIVDENKKTHYVNGDGVLLHRKPLELRLLGSKPGLDIFEIGSTADRYWLKIEPEMNTMWWGWYRNLGKPCAQKIPIRPDLIVEVLGVGEIDLDYLRPPVPVMRFNPDEDAYMLVWQMPLADRWVATREVWYDRQTLRPKLVLLFDENGRVVLRAYLSAYAPVDVPGIAKDQRPVVATDYRLFFPDSGSKLTLQLSDVELQRRNIPREGSIRFPESPDVSKVIQLDEACDP